MIDRANMTVAQGSRFGLECPVFHNGRRIIPRVPEPEVPTPESSLGIPFPTDTAT
jgi:hypothetical protein